MPTGSMHHHVETYFIDTCSIFDIVPFIYLTGVMFYTIHYQKKWNVQIISHYRAWRYDMAIGSLMTRG